MQKGGASSLGPTLVPFFLFPLAVASTDFGSTYGRTRRFGAAASSSDPESEQSSSTDDSEVGEKAE